MSRPASVAVTSMSSGFLPWRRALRRWPRPRRARRRGLWPGPDSGRSRSADARARRKSRLRARRGCCAGRGTPRGGGRRHARRSDRRPARRCRLGAAPRRRGRASRRGRARSAQCCSAQPPQTPKCGQIGAMRSALGCFDGEELAPVGMAGHSARLRRVSPGSVPGNIDRIRRRRRRRRRRDGRPRSIVRCSTTFGLDEEFAVAVAAADRRRQRRRRRASRARRETRRCRRRSLRGTASSRTMPFLTRVAPWPRIAA